MEINLSVAYNIEHVKVFHVRDTFSILLYVQENEAQSPVEKAWGAANLQSSQKFSIIIIARTCETKLGYVLLFLENTMIRNTTIIIIIYNVFNLLQLMHKTRKKKQ